jgi:uncharacterized protein (DUF983 family)
MVGERLHEVPARIKEADYNHGPVSSSSFRTQLFSIAWQRCPKCHEGPAFRSLLTMHEVCPVCGRVFEREPGYFVGAMYVSYALAIPVYLAVAGILGLLLRGWSDLAILALALPLFVPLAPILFRYSRVIWMHLDLAIDRSG